MLYHLHIKIIESINIHSQNCWDINPFIFMALKSICNGSFHAYVISQTNHPIWNNEYDNSFIDPNDVLLINMYNETDTTNEKIMDELQYSVNMWSVEGISERKEVNITYELMYKFLKYEILRNIYLACKNYIVIILFFILILLILDFIFTIIIKY